MRRPRAGRGGGGGGGRGGARARVFTVPAFSLTPLPAHRQVFFSLWQLVACLAGIVALFTNFWMDPKNGAQLYIPVKSAGLWQVCGLGNVTDTAVGTVLQELQTVGSEFKDLDSWIFGKGCSKLYGDEVVKFYSNIPVGPNGNDFWVWIQATGGLAVAFCVLCLIMIPVVASHRPYRNGCGSYCSGAAGAAHFLAFLQAATGLATIGIFVAIVAVTTEVSLNEAWYGPNWRADGTVIDPSTGLPLGFPAGFNMSANAAGMNLTEPELLDRLSGLNSSIPTVPGIQDPYDNTDLQLLSEGWSMAGNYWGWSFWVFVAATCLAVLGWPVLSIMLCCSPGGCCSGDRKDALAEGPLSTREPLYDEASP